MRQRTREKPWWAELAEWALTFAGIAVAGAAALLVHIYASPWAAPAIWGSLAILILATVAYFRLRRFRHHWLFIGAFVIALGFSILLAVMQGWEAQTNIGVVGGTIIFTIVLVGAAARSISRDNRSLAEAAREIGAELQGEGLFRDDGERITVYSDRGKLLRRALIQMAALAFLVGAYLGVRAIDLDELVKMSLSIGLGVLLCIGSVATLLTLTRLMMNNPTLIVNADGIIDNGSLLVTGRGLLRWNEILGFEEIAIDLDAVPRRFRSTAKALNGSFDINLTDFRAVSRRQPLWKRALGVLLMRQPLGPRIFPALLDRPAAELVVEINRYIDAHAPAGSWWHKIMTSEEQPDQHEQRP